MWRRAHNQDASPNIKIVLLISLPCLPHSQDSSLHCSHETALKLSGTKNLQTIASLLRVVEILLLRDPQQTLTKRDIYYKDTTLFGKQYRVDLIIQGLISTLNVPRDSLGITSSPKGLIYEHCQDCGSAPLMITPSLIYEKRMANRDLKLIIVVEKEAVFHTLTQTCHLWNQDLPPIIIITGKGYPDHYTMHMVHTLSSGLHESRTLALVDYDPYGLDIALRYKLGCSSVVDRESTKCESLRLLGVKRGQLDKYSDQSLADKSRLKLNAGASKRLVGVISKAKSCGWVEMVEAADEMMAAGFGTEIESLYGHETENLVKFIKLELAKQLSITSTSRIDHRGKD